MAFTVKMKDRVPCIEVGGFAFSVGSQRSCSGRIEWTISTELKDGEPPIYMVFCDVCARKGMARKGSFGCCWSGEVL